MSKIPREDLLAELERLADDLGRPPKADDMRSCGEYSVGPYINEFGGWNAAIKTAEMEPESVREIPKESLVEEMNRLADEFGRSPKQDEMDEFGEYSAGAFKRAFGSWNEALVECGYEINVHHTRPDPRTLIEHLQNLAEHVGETPTKDDMTSKGEFGANTYIREFGSWNSALKAAGLNVNQVFSVSDPELIDALQAAAVDLGRPPVRDEVADVTPFSHYAYEKHFGSWNNSLRRAGLDVNFDPEKGRVEVDCAWCGDSLLLQQYDSDRAQRHFCDTDCLGEWRSENLSGENHPNWKGGDPVYGPNWEEQRQAAITRDGGRCQSCGLENDEHKTEYGYGLHVHHIKSIREFEDTREANRLGNLVTLCHPCHHDWEGVPVRPQLAD